MWDEQDEKTAEEWKPTSERADSIHHILAITNCPKQVIQLVDILIGISNGLPEFDTTHRKIASRISNDSLSVDDSAKDWVKRAHKKLKDWQSENQLNLVEYEPGDKNKKGTHTESRYRLHIINFADDVIKLARKNPSWNRNKPKALKEAALALKPEYCPVDILYHKSRRTMSRSSEVSKYLSSSVNYMKKALGMLNKKNEIILIDDEIIEEYERVLNELKTYRLSEDFFLKEEEEEEE